MSALQQMLLAGQASDPYWSSVIFLAGCNTLSGSNVFDDEVAGYSLVHTTLSDPLNTPAISGLACVPSAGFRCQTSDVNGAALRTAIGSGQFTIEGWFRRTGTISGTGTFFEWGNINKLVVRCTSATNVEMSWNINSSTSGDNVTFTSLDTWMHWALTRDGSNNVRWFVQGNLEQTWASTGGPFSSSGFAGGEMLSFGGAAGGNYSVGCTDEVRFSTVCRYTSSFTPTPTPWPRG